MGGHSVTQPRGEVIVVELVVVMMEEVGEVVVSGLGNRADVMATVIVRVTSSGPRMKMSIAVEPRGLSCLQNIKRLASPDFYTISRRAPG